MKTPLQIEVRRADWRIDIKALRHIRDTVFVQEQRVPLAIEWDEKDPDSLHVLARDEAGQPVATGRLEAAGKIGRMAVLRPYRGRGIGGRILEVLVQEAWAQGLRRVYLHAQVHAISFYADFGFVATGPTFREADIEHRLMICDKPG